MLKNMKFIAAIIVFGSLWGFAECILGSVLRDYDLPAGAIMTGIFAIGLMTVSRTTFAKPGMQASSGLLQELSDFSTLSVVVLFVLQSLSWQKVFFLILYGQVFLLI